MNAELECCGQPVAFNGECDYRKIFVEFLFGIAHVPNYRRPIKRPLNLGRDGLKGNAFIRKGRRITKVPGGVCGASVSPLKPR